MCLRFLRGPRYLNLPRLRARLLSRERTVVIIERYRARELLFSFSSFIPRDNSDRSLIFRACQPYMIYVSVGYIKVGRGTIKVGRGTNKNTQWRNPYRYSFVQFNLTPTRVPAKSSFGGIEINFISRLYYLVPIVSKSTY